MFMKDAAFLEQLQQELPRRSLSPKATQRFEDTYKMLGSAAGGPGEKAPPQGAVGHGHRRLPVLRHAVWGERRVPRFRREFALGGRIF